jgi:hypothetical protein
MLQDAKLIQRIKEKAYDNGKNRGTSLSCGYAINLSFDSIFVENSGNYAGIVITASTSDFVSECPDNYHHFDMYDARN